MALIVTGLALESNNSMYKAERKEENTTTLKGDIHTDQTFVENIKNRNLM